MSKVSPPKPPKGRVIKDHTNIDLWFMLVLLSGIGLGFLAALAITN